MLEFSGLSPRGTRENRADQSASLVQFQSIWLATPETKTETETGFSLRLGLRRRKVKSKKRRRLEASRHLSTKMLTCLNKTGTETETENTLKHMFQFPSQSRSRGALLTIYVSWVLEGPVV